MASGKRRRLETTVATIHQRWGLKALRRWGEVDKKVGIPCIPTSFPALDQALGTGGVPRGRITEILGVPTSGMSTLAPKIISSAQSHEDTAVYVDLGHTFDPDYAVRCGVDLATLFIVRPHSGREALEITQALIASGSTGVLIFDSVPHLLREPLGARDMSAALRRMAATLDSSPCALIFLTPLHFGDASSADNYPSGFTLPHYASVRLLLEKESWIRKRCDVRGYRSRVVVLKNKLGPAGKSATIAITFNGVVQGNGT